MSRDLTQRPATPDRRFPMDLFTALVVAAAQWLALAAYYGRTAK